jgi:guanylate kinase
MAASSNVLVVTGPSGVGKGTLIRGLLDQLPGLALAISATTRKARPGEFNGRDYYFLSPEDFDRRVADGEFAEHATYAGNRYGTLLAELDKPGGGIVLEIDVQGARQVRETLPGAKQVFIAPPSTDELRRRLEERGSDSDEQIARRLEAAESELAAQSEFGHVVVNEDRDRALAELVSLAATIVNPETRGSDT